MKVSAAVADIVSKHLQVSKTRYFLQVMHFQVALPAAVLAAVLQFAIADALWTADF